MNKLNNTDQTGGYPLVMDDFRFIQDAWRDGFKGIHEFLYGILGFMSFPSNPNDNISAGDSWVLPELYVHLNGELLLIEETTLDAVSGDLEYYVVSLATSNDANGTKTFNNGDVHETYQVRKGQITKVASVTIPGDAVLLSSNGTAWEYPSGFTYKGKMLNYLDLSGIQSNSSNIISRVNELGAGWSTITPTTSNVKSSVSSVGASFEDFTAVAGGYIKYKKIGSGYHVDFYIQDAILKDRATAGDLISVYIDLTSIGISSTSNVRSVANIRSDQSGAYSGSAEVIKNGNKAVIRAILPFSGGDFARLNDTYNLATSPVSYSANNATITPTIHVSGQFVIEAS